MCISSNWVNDAQDLIAVKKFHDFQNSLIPSMYVCTMSCEIVYLQRNYSFKKVFILFYTTQIRS